MIDYTVFYKHVMPASGSWPATDWTLFLSAFTSAERVHYVFKEAMAVRKKWLIFPEYGYLESEYPLDCFAPSTRDESEFVLSLMAELSVNLKAERICIDVTGFIRPYLLYLLRYLADQGVKKFDAIYSEPTKYSNREKTQFSDEEVIEVRQVSGYEGTHVPDTGNDLLIIGSGYDHELISQVAENKIHARRVQMFGFPSLRADMYQENVCQAKKAEGAVGSDCATLFAPAYDPFVTAQVLSECISRFSTQRLISNLYLSPLATKAQVLGFGLYYVVERVNSAASIVFPFCRSYAQETSTGVSRVWKYTVELP